MKRFLQVAPSPWYGYRRSFGQKILAPQHVGAFTAEEIQGRHYAVGRAASGSIWVGWQWLVDGNGVIVDLRYQAYGPAVLLGVAEVAAERLLQQRLLRARQLAAVQLEAAIHAPALPLPLPAVAALQLVVESIAAAAASWEEEGKAEKAVDPGWEQLSKGEKMARIEALLSDEIRPYIALDGGDVVVKDIVGAEVSITYAGNCTTCFAATGATLQAIQQLLRQRLAPQLIVRPDLDALQPTTWRPSPLRGLDLDIDAGSDG